MTDAAATAATLFWTETAAIGQIAAALATAAAVIVSLWIVLSERRIYLRVTAGLMLSIPGDGTPATDIITIGIVNRGQRIARIEALGWRTGWLRRSGPDFLRQQHAMQNAPVVLGETPPFNVEPSQQKKVVLRASDFEGLSPEQRKFFTRQFPWSRSPKPANVCIIVFVSAHKTIVANVDQSLANFLATGQIERGAAQFNAKARAGGGGEHRAAN